MTAWAAMLEPARQVFRAPSYAVFTDLLTGWLLAPGRRTITAMIAVATRTIMVVGKIFYWHFWGPTPTCGAVPVSGRVHRSERHGRIEPR